MSSFLFTSESVSEGHPDKLSDQVSDAILDALLTGDETRVVPAKPYAQRISWSSLAKPGAKQKINPEEIARKVVADIGYTDEGIGFKADTFEFVNKLHPQSVDIAQGVDADGAGDQGLMFGYACNQTPELMPLPIALSHRILNLLTKLRHSGDVDWLRPDSKSQVSVRYENGKAVGIDAVVVSSQHTEGVSNDDIHDYIIEKAIKPSVPGSLLTDQTKYHINPTGKFVVGGPDGDTGLTGRKIIVDTYGGWGRHGGGAFSGKDSTKVDRSAAYMARYIAKNIVAAELATECEVQLAYAIGVVDPVSIYVDTNGTGTVEDTKLSDAVRETFRLTPQGIISTLGLKRPIFQKTAAGGHFGRDEPEFSWEKTDQIDALKSAV